MKTPSNFKATGNQHENLHPQKSSGALTLFSDMLGIEYNTQFFFIKEGFDLEEIEIDSLSLAINLVL